MSREDLPNTRAQLSGQRRELLERWLKGKAARALDATRIGRRPERGRAPLSFSQLRLWFLDQLVPGNASYLIPMAMRLTGVLDARALEASLKELTQRHEILRTSFVTVEGQPSQVIAPELAVAMPLVNLQAVAEQEREALAHKFIFEESQAPFDLSQAPLWRAKLLSLGTDDHVLLLMMHHIIADEWSLGVLLRDVAALYEALSTGARSALPDLPIQYADFAAWQQQWLQGEECRKQLSYWKEQLAGPLTVLELPTDSPRPPAPSFRGDKEWLSFPPELTSRLKELSRQQGATLFMTLLAAFSTLLHRYTGQKDVVVGTPVANRNRKETEGLIGCFVNTLVLRTDFSGDPSFEELLLRVRRAALSAYTSQDLPFEKLVEELQPERDLSRNPLCDVFFVFQNTPMPSLELAGLGLTPMQIDNATAKLDLTLSLSEEPDGLSGYLEYSTDLFRAATIKRMAGHLSTLLEGLTANPQQPVSTLPLLTATERRQLIRWNETERSYPQELCLHQLFESQVELSPLAPALVFDEQQITYRALNSKANQLAHHLRGLGVGPETIVAVCMERSIEMVVGLLGILKAGAAFLPLDPTYPKERLAFMLSDAKAAVVLTQASLKGALPAFEGALVFLDTDWPRIAQHNEQNPTISVNSQKLAYVIYTSGSTGEPKGVQVQHASVVNLSQWHQSAYGIGPNDRATQVARLVFDASVWEIWPYLTAGASIYLVDEQTLASPTMLVQWLAKNQITISFLPTPLAHAVLQESWPPSAVLRAMLTGGDVLRRTTEAPLPFKLVNNYGPTESTVVATWGEVETGREPAIGRPIYNTQVHILDRKLGAVPVGVTGEIYLGGIGLARGYLNRADLTAERFIPDPFSSRPGARLYKTGDLASYLAGGSIEFRGRADEQVKIRGYRIEPAEVETALARHAAVKQAVVIARQDDSAEKRLIAYVVFNESRSETASALRSFLKETLPDYMIPALFVSLEDLPLTPSGKIDRRALPSPDHERPSLKTEFVAARTPAEKALAEIWCQILSLPQVGVHDNFFELGGDSILSIQIIARARKAGFRFTPQQIFQHQTIAQLVAAADAGESVQSDQGVVTGPVPLSPIQRWFFEQEVVDAHHYNQALMLEVGQPLDVAVLKDAIEVLLEHHDGLRLRFERTAEGWRQFNAEPAVSEVLSQVDLSSLPEEKHISAVEATAATLQSSLNLSVAPLLRVVYFTPGSERPAHLLLLAHHLIVDAVSWRILLEDFETVYRQMSAGEAVALPAKTTSFKQWALRLEEYARSTEVQHEASYWLDVHDTQPLPVDYADGDNTVASEREVNVSIGTEQTRALLHEVPAAYLTQINDVLLTALLMAYARWSRQSSLLLDLEGHGREPIFDDLDVTRTAGWFTTIFPVLLEAGDVSRPRLALKNVKEQLRKIPRRGIGYGVLRYLSEDGEVERQLRKLPRPEVGFNYLGQLDQFTDETRLFRLSQWPIGPTRSPRARREHQLEINGWISEGRLQLSFGYSANIHRRETIDQLAAEFVEALQSLIAHCRSVEAGSYTPSDFPLAGLDQEALDKLSAANRQIEDIYPLSPVQQGMLFHSLSEPDSGVYVTQLSCELDGDLDVDAFEWAWAAVVNRHAILRTWIAWEGMTEPLQVVQRRVELKIERDDWRQLERNEQRQRLERYLEERRRSEFSFGVAPLMHLALIRTGERTSQFIWSHHHLLLDGWSRAAVLEELFACYLGKTRGREARLKARRPYRDYIDWLRRQDQAKAKQYWQRVLEGFGAATGIGVEREGGRTDAGTAYGEEHLDINKRTTEQISEYVRSHRLTLNTLALGAWALLVSRYSGEREVLFGTTLSGRSMPLEGLDQMVGLFINTLPMRVEIREEETITDWLKYVQEVQTEQRGYEYSSLIQVQRWSGRERGMKLFDSILVFENYPVGAGLSERPATETGLEIKDVTAIEQTNYQLTVVIAPGRELSLRIAYDRSLYEEQTIRRMLEHLRTILVRITTVEEQRLSAVSLLTEAERQETLELCRTRISPSPTPPGPGPCLHQLFELRVENAPRSISVSAGDQAFSYAELNRRANQLAHLLQAHGVGPEKLVVLHLERSIEMIVAMLAVLKAGGAYVPLDASTPARRAGFIIADTRAAVVITDLHLRQQLPATEATVICLEEQQAALAAQCVENPCSSVLAENAAYVIYTSGSTGTPKGVLVTHRNVTRLFTSTQAAYGFCERDVWTQFHSGGFDFSVWEIWGALLHGGHLVIVPHAVSRSPEEFYRLLVRKEVTVLNQTPSAFRQLMRADEHLHSTSRLSLRLVIFGGEALDERDLQGWFARHGDRCPQLVNMYGITETTVHVTYRALVAGTDGAHGSRIGTPLPDLSIYVLDHHMQPVPVGVRGELYVGGAGVARGYLDRPELTAERFVPDPFSASAGARLYRSGDTARLLSSGELEYLGRLDSQVKVRGFRIELGEVETALGQHEFVREAAVLLREGSALDKHLTAYLVLESEIRPSVEELRRFLSERLPEYMLPSEFVFLVGLPLTANGKRDTKALLALEGALAELAEEYVGPQTEREKELAKIWERVLGRAHVGVNDNFFDLGGDSILSLQVLADARQAGISFSLQQLFRHPTVRQLAGGAALNDGDPLARSQTEPFSLISEADRLKLQGGIVDAYPLARLQTGMLFHSVYHEDSVTYHNVSTLQLRTHLDSSHWQLAVQQLAGRHPVLRTSFDLDRFSEPLQLVHETVSIPCTIEDLRAFTAEEQERRLTIFLEDERGRRFNWSSPPLLRFHIHRLTDETFQLSWTEHHAILDGWSVASMLTELFQTYSALLNNENSAAGPLPIVSFRDFVALEQKALKSAESARYWSRKLEGSTFTPLPRGSSSGHLKRVPQVRSLEISLPAKTYQGLKHVAHSASVPLKSVFLAAHLKILSFISGQSDVLTGVVSNGRPAESGSERVLGLFLNTLPFRFRLSEGTWVQLMQGVFADEQELLPFRRYPLAELQSLRGGQSLFETMFNFVDFHVYDNLRAHEIEVLQETSFSETGFTLEANFVHERPLSQVRLILKYNAVELSDERAAAIAGYYVKSFEAISHRPHESHDSCSLLSEKESEQLVRAWNQTQADYPKELCIHHLFEAQVKRSPDACAVLCGTGQLTYRELDQRANRLACNLQKLGVGPEVLVGLYLERSPEMLVGLLGILKAGGAYVPLASEYPRERLEFMIRDSGARVLLTESKLRESLPVTEARVICLDTEWEKIAGAGQLNPANHTTPSNLAYVIYTSGSTGQPKAVAMPHRPLVNLICWQLKRSAVTPLRTLQFAPLSFDASFQEIFSTWCAGGTLVLITEEIRRDPVALTHYLSRTQIERLFLPFVALQHLAEAAEAEETAPQSLRQVITAGEQLKITAHIRRMFERLPQCTLDNQYGPSESHVASAFMLHEDRREWMELPPIGRPIANTEMYVLDDRMQPLPSGVAGQLYLGGDALARGYLDRPKLTADKFVPHPFSHTAGARLYRTGDLARHLPGGQIEFVGRSDDQVKVRGFRIELGEIEAVLAQHEGVNQAVVVVVEDAPGEKRLVAYVVMGAGVALTTSELRSFLAAKLPSHMLPAAFVRLEKLPLTASGKVDRAALPVPESVRPTLKQTYAPPRNPLEERLVRIWTELLKLDRVGINDDFFELGGDSLLATQFISRVFQRLKVELPVRRLFENPTVAEFAVLIEETLLQNVERLTEQEAKRRLNTVGQAASGEN